MLNPLIEKTISSYLMIGTPLVTIAVVASTLTDPVNVPKLLILGILAVGLFLLVAFQYGREFWTSAKVLSASAALFIAAALNAVLNSSSPLSQNLYGAYGRNTGFLTYIFLTMLLLVTATLRNSKSFDRLLIGFGFAGIVNVLYSLWAWQIGDFIPWSNPYKTILGTLGNPNFIGAFLGIFVSITAALILKSNLNIWLRLAGLLFIVIAILEIRKSHAVQGVAVSGAGIAIVAFFFIRSRFKGFLVTSAYVSAVAVVGIYALLGALQKGPLAQYVYKTSVSLRGEYWQAGWNMGNEFPFTGIGMDSYGDWYRRMRDDQALILPGPNTVTNAAHNIPFDLLAYGGWPLFISYVIITLIALVSAFKVIARNRAYDSTFVAIFVGWAGYQLQSIISINQIGLAIWGWVFSGALIAYEKMSRQETRDITEDKKVTYRKPKTGGVISPQLVFGIGAVIGLFIVLPPFNADAKWRSALMSGNVQTVEAALQTGYMQPADSFRYASAVQLFESNKLYDKAYYYAKIATEFNPDFFDSWKLMYGITNSTAEDKAVAIKNMKRLDPLNPDVQKLTQ
jgi:O-antigen ligase